MNIPLCPHCGKSSGTFVSGKWTGPGKTYYNENGNQVEMDSDNLCFISFRTVHCDKCTKRRRDLIINSNTNQIEYVGNK